MCVWGGVCLYRGKSKENRGWNSGKCRQGHIPHRNQEEEQIEKKKKEPEKKSISTTKRRLGREEEVEMSVKSGWRRASGMGIQQ